MRATDEAHNDYFGVRFIRSVGERWLHWRSGGDGEVVLVAMGYGLVGVEVCVSSRLMKGNFLDAPFRLS